MDSAYTKIFSGSTIMAGRIANELHAAGIEAVIKDEAESARLAGFASSMLGNADIYVNKDEVDRSRHIVEGIVKDSE